MTDIEYTGEIGAVKAKSSLRVKADLARAQRCRTLVCVLENPQNLYNITGVIRTAEGVGVGKIYIVSTKEFIPKTWQAMKAKAMWVNLTASGVKWVYIRRFDTTAECLTHLAKRNFTNTATSPHTLGKQNTSLYSAPPDAFTQHHLAVWFGNESGGLSDEAMTACKQCIQVPMRGIIESLNLCTSASIVLSYIAHVRIEKTQHKKKEQ